VIDPRRIETWGPAPRLLVLVEIFLLAAAAAYWWILASGLEELELSRDKQNALQQQFLAKKAQAVNLDHYRAQLEEMQATYDALLQRLPSETAPGEVSRMLADTASSRGISVLAVQPDQRERVSDFYAELPVLLRLAGPFDALGAHAGDLASSVRLVSAADFKLASRTEFASDADARADDLLLEVEVRVPRYLEEEEVAARRRAARTERGKR
jgi:type IV pilus assembly protein PilO